MKNGENLLVARDDVPGVVFSSGWLGFGRRHPELSKAKSARKL